MRLLGQVGDMPSTKSPSLGVSHEEESSDESSEPISELVIDVISLFGSSFDEMVSLSKVALVLVIDDV